MTHTRDELVSIVKRYFEILGALDNNNCRDVEAQIAMMAPDVSYSIPFLRNPIELSGRDGVRKIFSLIQGKFSDIRYDVTRWIVDEMQGIVVAEMHSERTLVHDGSRYENRYVLVFTIKDSLITDFREYLNPLHTEKTEQLIDPYA